jgi:hypothetical protein
VLDVHGGNLVFSSDDRDLRLEWLGQGGSSNLRTDPARIPQSDRQSGPAPSTPRPRAPLRPSLARGNLLRPLRFLRPLRPLPQDLISTYVVFRRRSR